MGSIESTTNTAFSSLSPTVHAEGIYGAGTDLMHVKSGSVLNTLADYTSKETSTINYIRSLHLPFNQEKVFIDEIIKSPWKSLRGAGA